MPARSLLKVATNTLIRRLRGITDIGDIPWELIAPVLRKIDDPLQLQTLEANSPWLRKYDTELWVNLVKGETPDVDLTQYAADPDTDWPKIFQRARRLRQKKVSASTAVLAAKLASGEQEKKSHEIQTDVPGRIKTANRQGTRTHWSQMGRKEGSNLSQGQKMLQKAKRESNNAVAVRSSNFKPVAPVEIREARQAGTTRGHLAQKGPAPLPKSSVALLHHKRDREAGNTERPIARPVSQVDRAQRPFPIGLQRGVDSISRTVATPSPRTPPQPQATAKRPLGQDILGARVKRQRVG